MGVGWPGGSGGGGGGTFPPTAPTIVPAWFRIGEFSYEDFSTDGTETNIVAYSIPPLGVLHAVLLTPVVRFEGEGLTSYTVCCGIPGEPERFTSPLAVADIVPGPTVLQLQGMTDQIDRDSSTPFWITARSEGLGLDGVTAGLFTVDILISLSPPPLS